ncbi:amino acid adenylation domain-containing protein [Schlegelella sp. S2-27]|uniref:Amino acid adenylation domain-containing protein n=1 Tax=Caldimonas mangrovi TaxID=2944811 RepID=A0ABT0YNN5_9BURK|nr:non-ribosomal peptide synthetase/type I polyketide synthase [Caldimonas mangrovi]MCM5680345.1 amino acid adenylation domain-containing protein [Caldimonas mangrovi]
MHHWLRAAARRWPDRVAVLHARGDSVDYRALWNAVTERAAAMTAAGMGPGDRVAIAAARSIETVIDIMAAVEAGLAYVPLDLGYPGDRIAAMLDDAKPRSVLGDADVLSRLEAVAGKLPTLAAPAPARAGAAYGAAPDLAYVLFTSGSTGRPKGVAMGARPLRHLIAWHAAHPRLGQPATTLQFAPLSFDVHFQEIFSTLACGGTLVMLDDAQRRDPAQLCAALQAHRVERIFLPYVALQMLAEAARECLPTHLRDVVSAGEQLQVTPAIRWLFGQLPDAGLHNHYGPTESHVVTAHELYGDAAQWPVIPPIGRALPHVALALRAPETQSVHGGDTGELLLGGDTLAHGYLGREDLSRERFRDDVALLPGRWYTTGDLVQRDAEGVYTYLGRADQQLKVDGFRIEPGEIEVLLMAHEAVRDAVVTAPELPGIGKQLIAHLVLRSGPVQADALTPALRAYLRGRLPEYMVPVRYVVLDRLPTTPSGKIDRRALPLPTVEAASHQDPAALIRSLWEELLGVPDIGENANLFELGAKSLLVLRFVTRLREAGMRGISVADIYDRPTIAGIRSALEGRPQTRHASKARTSISHGGIAIVGMATRTAGARHVEQFWDNLVAGREGIRHFSPAELDPSIPEALRNRPNFVAARGVLDDAGRFDAAYFGISAREATVLDPQQRLFLELCWTALEHAAIDPSRDGERVGVYGGVANNTYITALRQEQPELIQQMGEFAAMLASEKDYVATRVANRLNLNGPAVSIHTACSTGLVAVVQAWHALASGQCDVALAGGATVVVPQEGGYLHVEGGMESADGHCRPFDADASGTVFASGGGVVVLKRLHDALADGDTVYAVIRGVGLNNDGGDKASFTAPSVSGQAGAIRMALEHAEVSARSIGYVEAHGTGTALGDPIEVSALTRAWREDTADAQFCGLGSLKGNLGHTIAAAGVLGLVKAALSLHRELIPGTLHFRRPNPQIDFAATPFHVVADNTPWPRGTQPRRAAVSSFGVGGTNAHVVIEEAPVAARPAADENDKLFLLPLSARTPEAALQRARDLADHLERHPALPLADVAATLMRGRRPMAQRLCAVAPNAASAIAALRSMKSPVAAVNAPRVVFLFPGQGSQHPGMARKLYDEAPAFRVALDRCFELAGLDLGARLKGWMLDAEPGDRQAADALAETRHAQPALFGMSYALAAWLDSLGLQPDAMIGHSIGEYAAACHAGVFSLDDALAAVIERGQAMFEQPRGAMLAARAGTEQLAALLPAGIEIAGCNAPGLTVLAGDAAAIDTLATALESRDIGTTRLRVSHAFHSAAMDAALPRVAQALRRARLQAPQRTLYSCLSGAPLQASEATDPEYWARQVRATVQFSRAVQAELARDGDCVFVEVGSGQALTALLRQHRTRTGGVPRVVPLLGPAQDPGDAAQLALSGIGALWCAGVELAWPVASSARRIALPTYPFAGQHHWFARRSAPNLGAIAAIATPDSLAGPVPTSPLPSAAPPLMSRLPRLAQELKRILSDVSGLAAEDMNDDASFVDQGLDSLSLTQATLELEQVFGIKLRFRRLLEDLDTLDKVARFLDTELPADRFAPLPVAAPEPVATPAAPAAPVQVGPTMAPVTAAPVTAIAGGTALHQLIQQQMQLMSQQLALLAGQPIPATMALPAAQAAPPIVESPLPQPAVSAEPDQPTIKALIEKPFGAAARITLDAKQDDTPEQHRWLVEFIARYNARTAKSKVYSQQHRKLMADPRVVTGFNPLWKDLVYPIVADRSKGARIWDIDGNEYIDLLSCFGANLLGYNPSDVVDAMVEQLKAGIEVGPQHPLAAEVAQLISEFTGHERVAFCNTGSEAVMGAMRIARTVTGRKTIAIFTNSYHGIFDEVIVRGTKQLRSLSAAPGILANAVENVLVLDYASDDALRVLRERGPELAAIMIEPIQNKYPTLQPREFVQELRRIADAAGCALIFDEVVTGFRVAPGGAQEFYGVRADLCTYGKIIGGGLPFAAIGGGSHWLDALDGGQWQYGDDSYPEAGVTYFAGTFVRHPLALAAARASLLHLKRGGRELYRSLNERTQRLIERLNTAFAVRGAPVKAVHCASLWRLSWDDGQKYVSLFYYLVRFHGLHLYEQFGHFVTEAMGESELDRIFDVFTQALDELMALGFIVPHDGPPPPGGGDKSLVSSTTEGPLSPGQTERWLAASFDVSAARALNESFCVSLQGPVDVDALRAAVRDVMSRHDAFRISFDPEQPLQRVDRSAPVAITEVDLRDQPDTAAALDAYCTEASGRPFPLDRAPLVAVSLLRLASGQVVVHVVASHLVFDGWASSVFNAELAAAYRARSSGMAPLLPEAESPITFASRELQRMESPEGRQSLQYWQRVLNNPPAPLALGDRSPPMPRRYTGDTLRAQIDGELFARLRGQAKQAGATLFQMLLTAVTVMLQRQSGQGEFLVSIPYASQSLGRHGPLMADGVLDLPLRLACREDDTGAAVLGRVRAHLMDALEHPLMTQGTVARALGLRSTGDKPALTGVFFNLNPKVNLGAFAPLRATMHEGRKCGTLSQLFFNFYEKEDTLTLDLHYSTEFFSVERAQALVDALQAACTELAASLQAPLSATAAAATTASLPAVDPRLLQWNATHAPLPDGARVEQWIAQQAQRTPDATALVARGERLSYRQLEARANRFANLLAQRGVGADTRVGLCLSRNPDLVPALLGVLKTGAAYVPLDPGFPRDRLHDMAADAGVKLVITEAAHAELAGVPRERQLRVDDDAALVAAAPDTPLPPPADRPEGAPAYVIYTSGSTGKPKGVVLPQRAVCNFLASMKREPGLQPSDRLLAVTTLSFDIAVLELMLPLTVGACVVVAQREEAMDGEVLGRMIADHRINVMQATPTTWHMLLDAGWQAPAGFKALCGGEALPPSLAARLLAQGVELWNMYGPTETTVWSTLSRIDDANQRITVGRPIDNTQVWVVDDQLRPCGVGVEGEICIGGEGVALGYFKRPELTAEKFVQDPFSTAARARIYRTGDLGKWREDGTIEHLGRLDFQVKIRGYRIELGEIEARLAGQPGVARTVAIAREDSPGDVRLVAYFVAEAGAAPDPAALREALRGALPDYMLPQFVVPLPTMPLLPNGKIDRKSLPVPSGPVVSSSRNSTPPRNDLERTLAAAMQSVLKLAEVGIHDDFFSLGGHSLLAARLVGQINRELQLQLNLRALFEAPTVEKLAEFVERQRTNGAGLPTRAPIAKRAQQANAPLTLMQERIRFVEEMHPGSVMYNAPSCHRLRGPMDLQAFDRAFRELVRRQTALRTSIVHTDDGHIQRIDDEVGVTLLPLEDLSGLPEDRREQALQRRLDALLAEPIALDRGPLMRTRLFKLGEDHHALFFTPHHVVWDGWSFDLFYTEMSALYDAYLHGRTSPLPELPVTYGDFAQWHNEWLKSDEIRAQLDYWKNLYARSRLPSHPYTDLPRQAGAEGRGATEFLFIPTDKAERIRELAKQNGTTLSVVALSVYAAVMAQWLRDSHPAIGMPVRGRPMPEIEGVMGFFNNMLPLRLSVDARASSADWIRSVHRAVTEVYAHQDIPFEMLAQELDVGRRGAGHRLYQVMFGFQDARGRPTRWGPLAHERIKTNVKGATEDMNLWMVEIASGIECGVQYNADLFLPSTAAMLRDRLDNAFARLLQDPTRPLSQLLAMSDAEQASLARMSTPAAAAPAGGDFLDILHLNVTSHPDKVALRHAGSSLTLGELSRRIAGFDSRLASRGVPAGGTVAICVGDPVAQLVAALAVLRSGRSCLALPHGADASSIRKALAASRAHAVVADAVLTSEVPDLIAIPDHEIEGFRAPRLTDRRDLWGVQALPQRALGRRELAQLVASLTSDVTPLANDKLLTFDGLSRPQQLLDLCLALQAGIELVVAPASLCTEGAQLLTLVRSEQIGWLHAPAATWRRLLSAAQQTSLPLVAMIDAPESSRELVADLLAADCSVLSVYRPWSVQAPVAAAHLSHANDSGLIGRPLVGDMLRVAEEPEAPVPPGIAAPLWLAQADRRWDATGALCRWRTDGQLQYLGETGATAYYEGARLELAAVEARLGEVPLVRQAGVLVQPDRAQHHRLTLLVEPRDGVPLDEQLLQTALRAVLPAATTAPRVQWVQTLRRDQDGRPDPMQSTALERTASSDMARTEGTPTEHALIETWEALLAIRGIRVNDNFFDLGGTSLLAMQAVARLEERLGKRVSARRYVFESLGQLAAAYDETSLVTPAQTMRTETAVPEPRGVMDRLVRFVRRA